MASDQIGQLAYLILLGIAVGGYFVAQARGNLGRTAQQAAVWGLIFIGVIAGVGLWGDISNTVAPRQSVTGPGRIEVPLGPDGHYHLTLQVNGKPVDFVVDTGASDIVLSQQDAARVGLDPSKLIYSGNASTANGTVRTADVRIDSLRLGDITDRNLRVSVNEGVMDGSLLGMAYLGRFQHIEISGRTLILTR